MSIRVRIAPSPTGLLHIGTVRTALFNYLFAKKMNGTFIIRIEDTDKERSTQEYEANIVSGMKNLGLIANEGPENPGEYGPYRQSERTHIYRPYLETLLNGGKAYYCFCSQEELDAEREEAKNKKIAFRYSGKCSHLNDSEVQEKHKNGEQSVIRLKIPENITVQFEDLIRGKTQQNTKDLTGDMVIAKDLNTPLYNFVVVIDDYLMNITHVIRGEDHLSNTPKQILIYEAFGWETPQFAHLPLILNDDRSKLSKRKNAVSVDDYLAKGYLKEALINFLALLGWNDGSEKEIFSLSELCDAFQIERVNKAGAVFDKQRLDWLNGQYIKKLSDEILAALSIPYLVGENLITPVFGEGHESFKIVDTGEIVTLKDISQWVHHEKERITILSDIPEMVDFYCKEKLEYDMNLLIGKKMTQAESLFSLETLETFFEHLNDFSEENIRTTLITKIQELGLKNGEVLWPLRAALTGKERSPGAFEVASVLGKEKVVQRIKNAIEKLL